MGYAAQEGVFCSILTSCTFGPLLIVFVYIKNKKLIFVFSLILCSKFKQLLQKRILRKYLNCLIESTMPQQMPIDLNFKRIYVSWQIKFRSGKKKLFMGSYA